MPDFEIRYFNADGSLALIRLSTHASANEAHDHAQLHLQDFAHFEVRAGDGSPLPPF